MTNVNKISSDCIVRIFANEEEKGKRQPKNTNVPEKLKHEVTGLVNTAIDILKHARIYFDHSPFLRGRSVYLSNRSFHIDIDQNEYFLKLDFRTQRGEHVTLEAFTGESEQWKIQRMDDKGWYLPIYDEIFQMWKKDGLGYDDQLKKQGDELLPGMYEF